MKTKSNVSKSKTLPKAHKKLNIRSLDSSFESLQHSKTSFKPVKRTKIISVKPKIQTVPREVVDKASDDLSRILKNF